MSSSSPGIARVASPEVALSSPFASAHEHLLAELDWLNLLLHRQVLRLRAASLLREDQFRGLYISDEEVDAILAQRASGYGAAPDHSVAAPLLRDLTRQSQDSRAEIVSRIHASIAAGKILPLVRLAQLFSLTELDCFALLICAAPELDTRFETLYAYVQNDVTRKRPSADLIFKLYCATQEESLAKRRAFSPDAPLLRVPLLRFSGDPQDRELGLLSRPLRSEPRILDYLLDHPGPDERLRSFIHLHRPQRAFANLHLPEALKADLENAGRSMADHGGVVFLNGPKGAGKRSIAEAISHAQRRPLLVADLKLVPTDTLPTAGAIPFLCREALLQGANLFLRHAESVLGDDSSRPQKNAAFFESLAPNGFIIFVGGDSQLSPPSVPKGCPCLSFAIPNPDFTHRELLWGEAFQAMGSRVAPGVDYTVLANKFVLTGGEIQNICCEAANRAILRDPADPCIHTSDIETAVRSQSNPGLRRLAQKVNCVHEWTDLVLPPRVVQQLQEVCAAEKYRHVVYSRWGFDRRLAQGKGLNTLFCGPSGTGKTMASGILARELSLDLYKIDLSAVVSKYIGETEKQLSQIFHEARSSNAILFFDEADALFGKRSEVKDAHDRYANVEVAYLLQKMEEYEGIVILATNFRKNMDDAFTRRIHYIVEFPFPDAGLRERIWKGLAPPNAPLAADVNFAFLARQFELTGGNIRNIALAAAFRAAEAGGEIRMEHFIFATARELQKLGRLPTRAEFREYYDLIRSAM
jgi:ATP-dependent 26S proteasome regulatory subunit